MDEGFEWSDYPPRHVGPLAPPGAQKVENDKECVDIDECADLEDIGQSKVPDNDSDSDDGSILDTDGTDFIGFRF